MLVRFEYADRKKWEGPPEDAARSPDPRPKEPGWTYEPNPDGHGGLVRMVAIDDFDNELVFSYQDFYWLVEVAPGEWEFGSGGDSVRFILKAGQRGTDGINVPFVLPKGAILRVGVTVNPTDAVFFGLIDTVDDKTLHTKADIIINVAG